MEWDKSDTHEYKYLLSMSIHFTRNMQVCLTQLRIYATCNCCVAAL